MTDEDIVRVDCPANCDYAHQEHIHLEHADGCGQVWGVVDGETRLLDPFDLQRTAVMFVPARPSKRKKR